jgi:hypothetical protein
VDIVYSPALSKWTARDQFADYAYKICMEGHPFGFAQAPSEAINGASGAESTPSLAVVPPMPQTNAFDVDALLRSRPGEDPNEFRLCHISVFYIAKAAYCSVWRTKCNLPNAVETKNEVVALLFTTQQLTPFVAETDIDDIVSAAMTFGDDVDEFIKMSVIACQDAYTRKQEKDRKNDVTR